MFSLDSLFGTAGLRDSVSIYNDDDDGSASFATVLNLPALGTSTRIEIAPGYTLRTALENEIAFIKEILASMFGKRFDGSLWETEKSPTGTEFIELPMDKWRYSVIEFSNDEPRLDVLKQTLAIAPIDLELGFVKVKVDVQGIVRPACLYRPAQLFQVLSDLSYMRTSTLNKPLLSVSDGAQISDLFVRIESHDHGILDLKRVLELVLELQDLPKFSPLQVLGYFAILESVLTHLPRPDDRYETITRQITQKLALLNKRWQPPLDYSSFGNTKHETIWGKMYAYRSAIAHGSKPDFTKELSALGSSARFANNLVRNAVRKTIRQAFFEPQLLADLHNC